MGGPTASSVLGRTASETPRGRQSPVVAAASEGMGLGETPGSPAPAGTVRAHPGWTLDLVAKIFPSPKLQPSTEAAAPGPSPVAGATGPSAGPVAAPVPAPRRPPAVERRLLTPDETLRDLGLVGRLDDLTENVRAWFSRKILGPLVADIDAVSQAFAKAGLDHLSPAHPASFAGSSGLGGGALGGSTTAFLLKNHITITPVAGGQQPQSLMDLAQASRNDPMVQTRLRIEKYLAFASLVPRRTFVLGRIRELAKGPLMAAFSHAPAALGIESDAEILLSLFCGFLDEHLPSSDFYDTQPFSSRHFVPLGEKPSTRPEAVQLQQHAQQDFRLVTPSKIYSSFPGPTNLFQAIVFLVDYVHCHHDGFLGIGNLGSWTISLVGILNLDEDGVFS